MVLAAAFLLATQQEPGIDVSLRGVWATESNEIVDISERVAFFDNGVRFFDTGRLKWVAAGNYYGEYKAAKGLSIYYEAISSVFQHWLAVTESLQLIHPSAAVDQVQADSDLGKLELFLDPRGGKALTMVATNSHLAKVKQATLAYLFSNQTIDLTGHYADKYNTLDIQDEQKSRSTFGGTFTYANTSHVVKGTRFLTRGAFTLFDPHNDYPNGYGYVVWHPSPDRVSKMRDGETKTDEVLVWLYLKDKSFPNGETIFLKRG